MRSSTIKCRSCVSCTGGCCLQTRSYVDLFKEVVVTPKRQAPQQAPPRVPSHALGSISALGTPIQADDTQSTLNLSTASSPRFAPSPAVSPPRIAAHVEQDMTTRTTPTAPPSMLQRAQQQFRDTERMTSIPTSTQRPTSTAAAGRFTTDYTSMSSLSALDDLTGLDESHVLVAGEDEAHHPSGSKPMEWRDASALLSVDSSLQLSSSNDDDLGHSQRGNMSLQDGNTSVSLHWSPQRPTAPGQGQGRTDVGRPIAGDANSSSLGLSLADLSDLPDASLLHRTVDSSAVPPVRQPGSAGGHSIRSALRHTASHPRESPSGAMHVHFADKAKRTHQPPSYSPSPQMAPSHAPTDEISARPISSTVRMPDNHHSPRNHPSPSSIYHRADTRPAVVSPQSAFPSPPLTHHSAPATPDTITRTAETRYTPVQRDSPSRRGTPHSDAEVPSHAVNPMWTVSVGADKFSTMYGRRVAEHRPSVVGALVEARNLGIYDQEAQVCCLTQSHAFTKCFQSHAAAQVLALPSSCH